MSNTSYVITISTPRPTAETTSVLRLLKDTTEPREQCKALARWFERMACGDEPGNTSFDVQTSANAPVRAHGTITLTYASIVAGTDTVTLGGTVLTSSSSTTDATHFKVVTDATHTATNLATCINTNTTLNKLVSASSASGVVTVTALTPGAIGNQFSLAVSNSSGFALSPSAALGSGAGGCETAATNYSRG